MPRHDESPSLRIASTRPETPPAWTSPTPRPANAGAFYLGKHGTPESRRRYIDVLRQWEDAGRCLDGVTDTPKREPTAAAPGRTVGALLLAYWQSWKARGALGPKSAKRRPSGVLFMPACRATQAGRAGPFGRVVAAPVSRSK